jgi:hypothetical protein
MTINKIDMETNGMVFKQDHFPIVHISMKPNLHIDFYGTDNHTDFEINTKRLPNHWKYHTEKIEYRFNSSGLRMDKELSDIDEYIIGFGCSHTVGVGINLEDTWIHSLAEKLNIDYINASASGGSSKLCAINFFNMLGSVDKLPKAAIFSWPSSVRYCFYTENQFLFYLPRFIDKDFTHESEIYKVMLMTDMLDHEFIFYRNMVMNTCKRLGIAYSEFTFDGVDETYKNLGIRAIYTEINDRELNNDYARDIRDKKGANMFSHPGTGLHQKARDYVFDMLDKNFSLSRK